MEHTKMKLKDSFGVVYLDNEALFSCPSVALAHRLVKCWNGYDDLVGLCKGDALEEILREINVNPINPDLTRIRRLVEYKQEQMKKAIAEAEKE